ncbi:MAG: ribonuclease III [Actinophytocola sp.]|nr:ribonuclease III [Actinophytocola sp.]
MASNTVSGPACDTTPLMRALGVELRDELLTLALTHRSYAYENGGLPPNERLEFLGDAVLGLVVTDHLYNEHPDLPEGQLAKLRASVVNMHALAGVARGLGDGGLGAHLLLGKGEEMTGGRDKASILADGLEAMIGAVYLEHGIDVARQLVHRLFGDLLAEAPLRGAGLDWKTSLQELTAAASLGVPEYKVVDTGPDHQKEFTATVIVNDDERGSGSGTTKKEAEQNAAEMAWRSLSAELSAIASAASSSAAADDAG